MNPQGGTAPASGVVAPPYGRVARRLVPLLFAGYVVAYLNRVNIGFAKLEMMGDLRFSDTMYGLGAGIFFVGYFLFEVPSNLLLHKFGARLWIARIMITWGVISGATMFVTSPALFYVSRFSLGLAEAGFFPGIIYYLSCWFPSAHRARIMGFFISAIALSGVAGGPLSGWILHHFGGVHGLKGWQWLFLLESIPSVLIGVCVLAWLPSSIDESRWLSEGERKALKDAVLVDSRGHAQLSARQVFADGRVWALVLVYFMLIAGLYGIGFWMPQILRNAGISSVLDVGWLASIPYGLAAIAMMLVGRNSDRSGERRWHFALSLSTAAAGFLLIGLAGSGALAAVAGLVLATCGVLSAMPIFWTLPTGFLGGAAGAIAVALINSVGNLAGFLGPYAVGALNDATGRQSPGLFLVAAMLALGAVACVALVRRRSDSIPHEIPSR
jgi:D-galactonate transporter